MSAKTLDRKKDPEFHRHYAKVMIRETKIRRASGQERIVATLTLWARNGRRRYWAAIRASKRDLTQGDLFRG